jgi:hypothetical protein
MPHRFVDGIPMAGNLLECRAVVSAAPSNRAITLSISLSRALHCRNPAADAAQLLRDDLSLKRLAMTLGGASTAAGSVTRIAPRRR